MNSTLRNLVLQSQCSMYVGDKGSGKSCLMALACDTFLKQGYKVFSNYPYKGTFKIPYKTIKRKNGSDLVVLDKDFLYYSNLCDSLVMIDEARTVWNARAYASWTELDEEFFNFIRKNNTFVILATQRYDGVDLNCRFASDYTFFIQRHPFFKNVSTVDVSRSVQLKIADTQTRVVSRGYSKNAQKVVWDIGEVPIKYTWFFRKRFYNDFDTRFVNASYSDDEKYKPELWTPELLKPELKANDIDLDITDFFKSDDVPEVPAEINLNFSENNP